MNTYKPKDVVYLDEDQKYLLHCPKCFNKNITLPEVEYKIREDDILIINKWFCYQCQTESFQTFKSRKSVLRFDFKKLKNKTFKRFVYFLMAIGLIQIGLIILIQIFK